MVSARLQIVDVATVQAFFEQLGRHVVTFGGFGELGYQDPNVVADAARRVLSRFAPDEVVVNTATMIRLGGENGIADVYTVARDLGILTTSVHPSIALSHHQTHVVSPWVQHAFVVEDDLWGGVAADGRVSRTLEVMLSVSDELVMIGGGKHAAGELRTFVDRGIPTTFVAAEMNHEATRKWCASCGIDVLPFAGDASAVWREGQAR